MAHELQPFVNYIAGAGANLLRNMNPLSLFCGNRDSVAIPESTKGTTVMVEYIKQRTARDVVVGTAPTGDIGKEYWPVSLDWMDEGFTLSHLEIATAMDQGTFPKVAAASLAAVVKRWNAAQLAKIYKRAFMTAGAINAVPDAVDDIIDTEKALNTPCSSGIVCPNDGTRVLLLDSESHAKMELLPVFHQANTAGNDITQRTGRLPAKFGFGDIRLANYLAGANHTTGTGDDITCHAAFAAGATSGIFASTAGGKTFKIGDIFTVAGQTQKHVCRGVAAVKATAPRGELSWADCTFGGANVHATVEFYPPVPTGGWADTAAVTLVASHGNNLGFHPDALALASRELKTAPGLGTVASTVVDNGEGGSGLVLRLQHYGGYMYEGWAWDINAGIDVVQPEFIARLLRTAL